MSVRAFYDELAPRYHLIYADWEDSVVRQGAELASLLTEHWPAAHTVFDVAVGIGTQALGLSAHGYAITGSDLSSAAVVRARAEAKAQGRTLPCLVADFRLLPVRSASVQVLLACDNSLPHVENETEVARTLAEWFRVVQPGGGCLLSMRDYGMPPPSGTVEIKPYGERWWQGVRYDLRQIWTWTGPRYEVAMEIAADGDSAASTLVKTSYLAIEPSRVEVLMREAGFERVQRLDDRFFQPVLVGSKPR